LPYLVGMLSGVDVNRSIPTAFKTRILHGRRCSRLQRRTLFDVRLAQNIGQAAAIV
jgi:hypothetical protein